ncbi:penicillin-binding protein 1C [Piscinibacter sp. HJYY11]|uniref:penicillin-binding protein 1C n=1 Tax=Piscinibacter sp. HJYY11 TaxID=2801333 RepID=UPI002873EE64|nr:penicillin-binding protein 1C [Piscinibacter sp. HJYY11]
MSVQGKAAALLLALGLSAGAAQAVPSFAEVKAAHKPSDVTLVDRSGTPIQTVRVDKTVRRLPWVPLTDISPALLHAIVLSEDQRFYQHSGVDWSAVAQSAWGNLWNTRTRGASTLTMQLAGLLDDELARPTGGRSVSQKMGQAVTASRLEARWKKSEILEAYLNRVAFRGELVGVAALSQTLFGKHPSGLDAQEAALAAALLRSPNADADTAARRACGVLQQQKLECTGVVALAHGAFRKRGGMVLGEQLAPHVARQLTLNQPVVRTTLDARLQRFVVATLRRHLAELGGRNVEDGAVLVLDNKSGEVLAWVGSSGGLSEAAQVDGVVARRQAGSTLKPFLYGLAFERRLITPASLLDDSPAQIATSSGLYLPQNYDKSFKGWVSARTALGGSLNVPAVRVGAMLGPEAVLARLNALGFALPESAGFYGHALALGGADVTLQALTNAYRSLANGGVHAPVVLQAAPTATRAVADPAATYLVTDILADNAARAQTFGLDSALVTPGFAAVKTGTSKDMRDNWCIGYTDRYTVGVWVGNASGEAMHQVSGVSGAAPIWQALVRHLHDGRVSKRPPLPQGIVQERVLLAGNAEPARDELFLAGTTQAHWQPSAQMQARQRYGITSPRDGSLFAIDPDMPPRAQRIHFEGERGTWVLDGKRIGEGARVSWAPWPGRHELQLIGRDGREIQRVRFEVRGAGVKTAQLAR